MTTARFRYIGTTDETTTCEKCGKVELRNTVMVMPLAEDGSDDGEVTYYGSTCAARALGVRGGGAAVRKAADGARVQTLMAAHDALRVLRAYGLPLVGEMTEDQRRAAIRVYVSRNNTSNMAPGERVTDRVRDLLARKRAAIGEAVLVAGESWTADRQPLEWGYRSAIRDTFTG